MQKLFVVLILFLAFFNTHSMCLEFENAVKSELDNLTKLSKEEKQKITSHRSVQKFKENSPELVLEKNANRNFMDQAAHEKKGEAIYFDVENSIQKKMNDDIFQDKGVVDALNNRFLTLVHKEVSNDPILSAALKAQYKDYKGLRLRLVPKTAAERNLLNEKLKNAYENAQKKFQDEVRQTELHKLYATRTDDAQDPSLWFLAGSSDHPVNANMAARYARRKKEMGRGAFVKFSDIAQELTEDFKSIENLRGTFKDRKDLINLGATMRTETGEVVLSKDAISILRKKRPMDFTSEEAFFEYLEERFFLTFGKKVPREELKIFSQYFEKVDSLSPPLFQRERVLINLEEAKEGLVSVDFTGVGVDNAYEQMRALTQINLREKDAVKLSEEAFSKLDKYVGSVTDDMNLSKRFFSEKVSEVRTNGNKPKFSGDDGMYMPEGASFSSDEKKELVKKLSSFHDPSKFRLTFVSTKDKGGVVLSAEERSKRVIRAEKLEKSIRDSLVGIKGFDFRDAKKLMIAVDYVPNKAGGDFMLLLSPAPDKEIQQRIYEAFYKNLDRSIGERATGMAAI